MAKGQYRTWCWTLNNYTDVELGFVREAVALGQCSYLCFGKEVGENLTPHLQGYLELDKPKALGGVKKIGGLFRAHFEARRGTQEEAIQYTAKDGDFFEFGTKKKDRKGQNENLKQERLRAIKKKIDEGADEDEIFEMDPVIAVQHDRWIEKQRMRKKPKRKEEDELKIALFIGKPGTGKTRAAYQQFPDIYSFPIGKDLWADNYNREKDILIDDFSGGMRLVDLLRLLDRYTIQVPKKGGQVWWCPNNIIITTNVHPGRWYDYTTRTDSAKALKRRIHAVFDFDNPDENGDAVEIDKDLYWHTDY